MDNRLLSISSLQTMTSKVKTKMRNQSRRKRHGDRKLDLSGPAEVEVGQEVEVVAEEAQDQLGRAGRIRKTKIRQRKAGIRGSCPVTLSVSSHQPELERSGSRLICYHSIGVKMHKVRGVLHEIVDDEVAMEDDEKGETKVDANGRLLGCEF